MSSSIMFSSGKKRSARSKTSNDKMIAKARMLQSQSSDNESETTGSEPSNRNDLPVLREGGPALSDSDRPARITKRKPNRPSVRVEEPTSPEASPLEDVDGIILHDRAEWDDHADDDEDTEPRISRKKSRAAEEAAYEAANPSPDTVEHEFPRDRSFSRSLFSPEDHRSRGQHQNAQVLVPSNISINAIFFCVERFDYNPKRRHQIA